MLPDIGKVRYRILNILKRFMVLPEKEIKDYQSMINKKLSRILSDHQIASLSMTPYEIAQMPEYEQELYNEAVMLKRHLDIQQKIHFKTRYTKI